MRLSLPSNFAGNFRECSMYQGCAQAYYIGAYELHRDSDAFPLAEEIRVHLTVLLQNRTLMSGRARNVSR
jgi:hypothetical protein